MDAALGITSVRHPQRATVAAAAISRWIALTATALFIMAATVLASRRFAGALVEPLSATTLIATGLVASAAVYFVRSLSGQVPVKWLLSVALVLMAFAVSLPGSSWLGLATLWLLIVGEETWAWRLQRGKPRSRMDIAWRHTAVDTLQKKHAQPQTLPPVFNETPSQPFDNAIEPTEDWIDSIATQRLKYSRTAEGAILVEGWLRAEFIAGQRTAIVHAAFCPAFSRGPEVDSEPLDGPDCQIRTAQALPWGIRWEVKLDRAATGPTSVVLGFVALDTTDC